MDKQGTIHNTQTEFGFDHSQLHTYSGYLKSRKNLLQSASGGAVTAVSEEIVKRGGVVFGASYSDDFKRSEYRCVDNLTDLERLKGSKYCETSKEIVQNGQRMSLYSVLEDVLTQNRPVLFVGLGCDVGAVKAYCDTKGLNTENLFLIDLVCHGPTSAEVHRQYIDRLEKQHHAKLVSFTVRYKKDGWSPSYIHAEFENGKIYETPFYESDYGFAFIHYARPACYCCKYRGESHKGDITCGDFWGLTNDMNGWNENGVSIMFVRTKRGEELIDMIDRDSYHIEEADTAFALKHNHMYYECREKWAHYDKFGNDLKKRGLHYAATHYPMTAKEKVKQVMKRLLPEKLVDKARKHR